MKRTVCGRHKYCESSSAKYQVKVEGSWPREAIYVTLGIASHRTWPEIDDNPFISVLSQNIAWQCGIRNVNESAAESESQSLARVCLLRPAKVERCADPGRTTTLSAINKDNSEQG